MKPSDSNPSSESDTPKQSSEVSTVTKLIVGGVVGGFAAAKALGLLSFAAKAAAPAALGYLARKVSSPATRPPATPAPETTDPQAPQAEAEADPEEELPAAEVAAEENDTTQFFDPFASPTIAPLAKSPTPTFSAPEPEPEPEPVAFVDTTADDLPFAAEVT